MAENLGGIYWTADINTLQMIDGTKRIQRGAQSVQKSFLGMERSAMRFSAVAAAVFSSIAVSRIAKHLDAYTNMQNQLRIVTKDSENLLAVTERLNSVANNSRQGVESTVDLYSKLARATSELGMTQEEVASITETINKSFAISGATATEADNAIRQLAQGLSAGALRGDEFNSVAEQAPGILRAVAQETGKSIGELRDFAAEGGITTELLISALQNYSKTVDREFASANVTISQGATRVSNAFTGLAGEFDEATGTSGVLSGALVNIGEALESLSDYIRADAIEGPFSAQFEGVISDINSFINILNTEFETFFNGVAVAGGETGTFLGKAFYNMVPNIRAAIKIATVEMASFLDLMGAYGDAVAKTLNPFDDFDSHDARMYFQDRMDEIQKIRMSSLAGVVDQHSAEVERTKIAIKESENRVEQYRKERKERADSLNNTVNGTAPATPKNPIASPESTDTINAIRAEVQAYRDGANALAEFNARKALGAEATQAQIEQYAALQSQLESVKEAQATAGGYLGLTDTQVLEQQYEQERQLLLDAQALGLESTISYEERLTQIKADYTARRNQIEQDAIDSQIAGYATLASGAGTFTGAIAESIKKSGDEQSSAYKAMFALTKAFAIAQAGMNLSLAITQAMADPTALTLPQKLFNYGAIAAAGAGLLTSIQGASMGGGRLYGGQVSPGKLYPVSEDGNPEMLVSKGKQYLWPGAHGEVISNKDMSSSSKVENNMSVSLSLSADTPEAFRQALFENQEVVYNMVAKAMNDRGRQL